MANPTNPEVFERIHKHHKTMRWIEDAAQVKPGFLASGKCGFQTSDKAVVNWDKCRAVLDRLDAEAAGAPKTEITLPKDPETKVDEELIRKIKAADSPDEVLAVTKHIAESIARGIMDPNIARALGTILTEQRQTLKLRIEQQQVAKLGEPEKVIIEFVNKWEEAL